MTLRLRDTRARAVRNVLGNVYLSSLTKNLWYEQREQLDSGGEGTLSQGAGHDGSFNLPIRSIAVQKRAVQFTKKPYFPLFLSETADKLARDYAIKKSFRRALHLVTVHLHRQNEVAHALHSRDFWLASLSIDFPIHFARRVHEYPVTLRRVYKGKH